MKDNLSERVGRVEALIAEIESASDAPTRDRVRELVDILLDVHGTALERMLGAAADTGDMEWLHALCERDEVLSSVLILHGVHPVPMEDRVQRALEEIGPYLATHGGGVDLAGIAADGSIYLNLRGSCSGCPSSMATLKSTIEDAVFSAAPDVRSIQVVEPEPEASDEFIPISDVIWEDCPFPAPN